MTKQIIHYVWQWQLKSSPAELWPYASDTRRLNEAAALPRIEETIEIPLATGGSQLINRINFLGQSMLYEDWPYDWVHEQMFSNVRLFKNGLIARIEIKVELEPLANGGTQINHYVDVTPANWLGVLACPYQFGWKSRQASQQVYQQMDEFLQHKVPQPFKLKVTPLSHNATIQLREFNQQLVTQGHAEAWVNRLADLLTHEADSELARLRPYKLADQWHAPRQAILELFLSATKLGLLSLSWHILCPLCRGDKASYNSLDQLQKGVHCDSCNIDFEADFAQHVELTFAPAAQIRPIYDATFCVGGPMVTPHILLHQTVPASETRQLQFKLAPGHYRLRTQKAGVECWLNVDATDNEVTPLIITADSEAIQAPMQFNVPTNTPTTITLNNQATYPQRIYLERGEWYTDAVTAAEVTALQHFRDLFSDEVLRPGEDIGIQGITILFSDLVGSTAMYNRWGDAASYALVRKQFEILQRIVRANGGGLVKTIGDAIMAAFVDPANAVSAAWAIQKEVDIFNLTNTEEPLIIKLGLHYGPCIAVTLNGRLDYFGTTVNMAARLEGQSKGHDMVISESIWQNPAVQEFLQQHNDLQIIPFETNIKGFDKPFKLYRLIVN